MDDLQRSFSHLGLAAPTPAQLLELLDASAEGRANLGQVLALSSAVGESGGAADLMGAELLTEAVRAILESFSASVESARKTFQREQTLLDKPGKVKPVPKKAHLARHAAALARAEQAEENGGEERTRLIFDGGKSYCSFTPLEQLSRIHAADLTHAPKRYDGTYLLLRTIAAPLSYVGVLLLAEDPHGSVVPLSISHVSPAPLTQAEALALFPLGTKLALREPYLSPDHAARAAPGKPTLGVRVDSPTDLCVLEGHESVLEGVEWSSEEAVSEAASDAAPLPWLRDGPLARLASGASLPSSAPDTRAQVLARVTALLLASRPGAAWRELRAATSLRIVAADDAQALALQGRMYYLCEEWAAAVDAFARAVEAADGAAERRKEGALSGALDASGVLPLSLSPAACLKRAQVHLERASREPDASDVQLLYFTSSTGAARLDVHSYVGPVTVRDVPGAGRGLVAERDVKCGEVMLLQRAVAPSYPAPPHVLRYNLDSGLINTTSELQAQTALVHALVDRPELQLPILGLTAGPVLPYSPFVANPAHLMLPSLNKDTAYVRPSVDSAYIDGVLRFNAFSPAPSSATDGSAARRTMPHAVLALINHGCLPNTIATFHADVVLLRALRDLNKDEEIFHHYVEGDDAYAVRCAGLSKHAFRCACEQCSLDEADGEGAQDRARIKAGEMPGVLERSRAVRKMRAGQKGQPSEKELEANTDVAEALEALAERIDATYSPNRGSLRPDLFDVLHARAAHLALSDVQQAVECEVAALCSAGAHMAADWRTGVTARDRAKPCLAQLPSLHLDGSLGTILNIAALYTSVGDVDRAYRWAHTAAWMHESIIGGGTAVLRDRLGEQFEKVLDVLDLREERQKLEM